MGAKGGIRSPFVIVGESPGVTELSQGIPFVGPSGKLLSNIIPEDINPYITNALQCLPRKKDPKKLAEACKTCNDRLLSEIKAHPRKIILALGNGALWSLTGDYNLKITQERGKVFPSGLAEHGIVACLHPAFLLRGGGSVKKFHDDVKYAIDFSLRGKAAIKKSILPRWEVISTTARAEKAIEDLKQYKDIGADVEATGFDHREDKILSIGLAGAPEKVYIFPGAAEHSELTNIDERAHPNDPVEQGVWTILRKFLEGDQKFIWHNGKFDIKFLREIGIQARVDEDTMLLNYSLDDTRGVHGLEQVGSDTIGMPNWKKELDQYLTKKGDSYCIIPRPILNKYLSYDVSSTLQIFNVLRLKVSKDRHSEKMYVKTLIPASEFLASIEMSGFKFDWNQWQKNKDRLTAEVSGKKKILCDIAGYDINPNSPAQIAKLLYDDLQIPSKHGRSTGKDILAKLPEVPAVTALKKYRVISKALSTYVEGMAKNIGSDNKAHSTYLIHGTSTGRLSSRQPNLQNIPRDADLKSMFIPDEGHILLDIDYSQAELRSLAQLSGDEELREIFCSTGRNLHKEVAVDMYGENYTPYQYIRAKAVNFGIPYGREAFSIAEEFDISKVEAKRLINTWFDRFPKAHDFIKKCRDTPIKQQTMITVFGRKKRPQLVTRERLKDLQNEAANFPHQSTASDLTLHAGIIVEPQVKLLGAKVINIVHDSLIITCPDKEETILQVEELVINIMQQVAIDWGLSKIPFLAESKRMCAWGLKD